MDVDSAVLSRLDKTFAALADPTRRAILQKLMASDASVSELVQPFRLAQPTISKHLKVLENAGLIARGRDAQRRPRQLLPGHLKEVADWLEPFRREWEARFSNLDAYVMSMSTQETQRGTRRHKNNR